MVGFEKSAAYTVEVVRMPDSGLDRAKVRRRPRREQAGPAGGVMPVSAADTRWETVRELGRVDDVEENDDDDDDDDDDGDDGDEDEVRPAVGSVTDSRPGKMARPEAGAGSGVDVTDSSRARSCWSNRSWGNSGGPSSSSLDQGESERASVHRPVSPSGCSR